MCCSNSILAGLVEWRSESIEKYSSSGGKREASKLEESGQADKKGFTQLKKYLWNKSHHFYKRHVIEIRFTLLMKEKNLQKEVYLNLYFVQCSEAGQRGVVGDDVGNLMCSFDQTALGDRVEGGGGGFKLPAWWDTWEYVTLGKCDWRSIFFANYVTFKTLPKALRTQALTTLFIRLGLVGLVW